MTYLCIKFGFNSASNASHLLVKWFSTSFLKLVPIYFRFFSAIINDVVLISINISRFYISSYAILVSFFSPPKNLSILFLFSIFFYIESFLSFFVILTIIGSVVISLPFLLGKWCLLFVPWQVLIILHVSLKQHLPLLLISIGYCLCIYIFSFSYPLLN